MSVKKTLVEIAHDEGYGDSLLLHINNAFEGKDMLAVRIVTIEKTDQPHQEKPKQFRPFANAAEFEPFRNRWWKKKVGDDRIYPPGYYNDVYHCGLAFKSCFTDRTFDNGDPFGIEVSA